ncbi:CaiF/GrlA family transcriptional regulator [Dryocola boscaweniae]|uniref:CaiF/GrlA family transcriptional regulator n=1 Tax=Dryocola boscaweniae TaxID=2925397 RepID=UPI0038CD6EA6
MNTPIIIKPSQANHFAYLLPEEIKFSSVKWLYYNVALWGLTRKKPICCRCVSHHFGISIRQATNVISMIHRRYNDIIQCQVKLIKKDGVILTHLTITSISSRNIRRCRSVSDVSNIATGRSELQLWKQRFLHGAGWSAGERL